MGKCSAYIPIKAFNIIYYYIEIHILIYLSHIKIFVLLGINYLIRYMLCAHNPKKHIF